MSCGTSICRATAGRIEDERLRRIRRRLRVEHIVPVADVDLGFEMRHLEMVVAFLDHLPERHVRIGAVPGEVRRRHAERIGLDLEFLLAAEEGFARQRIDFADLLVGHGVAAARRAIAVDHQERAAIAVRFVVGVGEADIDGEIVVGIGIHQAGRDRVEALRRLAVAFDFLRPELARPAADRINLEQLKLAGGVLLPDFELRFLLEDAHEDRRVLRHIFLLRAAPAFPATIPSSPGSAADSRRRRSSRQAPAHRRAPPMSRAHASSSAHRTSARTTQARIKAKFPDRWTIPLPSLA